jgi:hypothetical protein
VWCISPKPPPSAQSEGTEEAAELTKGKTPRQFGMEARNFISVSRISQANYPAIHNTHKPQSTIHKGRCRSSIVDVDLDGTLTSGTMRKRDQFFNSQP